MAQPQVYRKQQQSRGGVTLSSKQEIFINEYVRTGDLAIARQAAGYKKTPSFFNNPEVLKLVNEKIELARQDSIASGTDAMIFLSQVMNGEIKDQFGLDATLKDRLDACKEILKRTVDLEIKAKERQEQAENEFHLSIDWTKRNDDTNDLNEISNNEVIIENEE